MPRLTEGTRVAELTEYEQAMAETRAWLSIPENVAAVKRALADVEAARVTDLDTALKELDLEPVTVTVYSKSQCVQCDATKNHLKRLNIPYTEVDIETDAAALAELKADGWAGAPVVKLSTGDAWQGYRPDKIKYVSEGF